MALTYGWARQREDSDVDSWHDPVGPRQGDDLTWVTERYCEWVREARNAISRRVIVEAAEAAGLSDETIASLLAEYS